MEFSKFLCHLHPLQVTFFEISYEKRGSVLVVRVLRLATEY